MYNIKQTGKKPSRTLPCPSLLFIVSERTLWLVYLFIANSLAHILPVSDTDLPYKSLISNKLDKYSNFGNCPDIYQPYKSLIRQQNGYMFIFWQLAIYINQFSIYIVKNFNS